MSEQELTDIAGTLKYYGLEDVEATMALIEIAKAYAAAQVAAKDAEILKLQAEINRLMDMIEHIDSLCDVGPNMDSTSTLEEIQNITHGALFNWYTVNVTEEPKPDENGLLPCPFCGGEAELLTYSEGQFNGFQIRCSDISCHAYKNTQPINYWPMAQLERQTAKWNQRA